MDARRAATDVLSVLSLLAVLIALTWLFELVDAPVAQWLSGATGADSPEAIEQGLSLASQALSLFYVGIVLLAGFVGGKFLRGRPVKVRIAYFVVALVLIGLFWLAGRAPGIIVPTIMSGRVWPILPLFLLFLSTGWAYGTKSVGKVSDAAWTGASVGTSAGEAGRYVAKSRDDISDFFN